MIHPQHAIILATLLTVPLSSLRADDPWVTYEGGSGPGQGKHVVLIAGDEEYRSEEALPQLGKILSKHHGFKCTVLFSIDPKTGMIEVLASFCVSRKHEVDLRCVAEVQANVFQVLTLQVGGSDRYNIVVGDRQAADRVLANLVGRSRTCKSCGRVSNRHHRAGDGLTIIIRDLSTNGRSCNLRHRDAGHAERNSRYGCPAPECGPICHDYSPSR